MRCTGVAARVQGATGYLTKRKNANRVQPWEERDGDNVRRRQWHHVGLVGCLKRDRGQGMIGERV